MAKDVGGASAISEESIGYLEEVKKGKPRKFAMICKGTSVVSLVVYKKGNVEKRKKEAKESGKGQFYFGVVDGKGINIRFVLARADGFESEPVKTTSLKGFLDESADFKCKPYFEIVDAAPLVLDEDDPLVARFLKLQEAALQASDSFPDRSAEINTLCRQIGSYLDQDQPDQATVNLDTLETLLGELGEGNPPAAPPPTSNDVALEAKLLETLKKLKPLFDNAIELHPTRRGDLVANMTQIQEEIKSKQFTQAQTDVIALGKLLKTLSAEPATSSKSEPSQSSADLLQRLKIMSPAIKSALAGPDASRIQALVAAVKDLLTKKDLMQAGKLLDELEPLLGTATAGKPPPPESSIKDNISLVKLGKSRLEWNVVRQHAIQEIKRLKEVLLDEYNGIKDEQEALATALQGLDSIIASMNEELGDRLDELLNAASAERPQRATLVKSVLQRFISFVESDRIMSVIDRNEYAPDMVVAEPLRAKLLEIAASLG